jgi:hypothetical protein
MFSEFLPVAQAFSALTTPLIAVMVAYIAYQQHETARAKLNLDLFERRMAVYEQLRAAVAAVNGTGRVDDATDRLLLDAINASQFLFGQDIHNYLDAMWRRFSQLRVANIQTKSGDPATRKNGVDAQSALFKEITQFYYDGGDVFAHYMRMDQRLRKPVQKRSVGHAAKAGSNPL